jgi:hypothetical protein
MKKIGEGIRIYPNKMSRMRAFEALTRKRDKHRGRRFNYVVFFKDVQGPALQIGNADWVPEGGLHVDW